MTERQPINPGGPPPQLLAAIEKILKALVRLLLSYQITYPLLIGMLKSTYVEVAEKEFQVNGKRQSDSRINLLTGVHRKDVKRLRAEARAEQHVPSSVSIGAQIVGQWLGTKEYLDETGKPRALALKESPSSLPGFDELVSNVCKQNIRPRVILDEWIRLGVAHVENDHVILNTGAFTPEQGFDEKAFFFGKNIQDHISASAHNLSGRKPSYFDRSVYYDRLSGASVEQLGALADSLGMQALTQLNKEALARQTNDDGKPDNHFRINFGVFNFSASTKNGTESQTEDDN